MRYDDPVATRRSGSSTHYCNADAPIAQYLSMVDLSIV
jgi:hypothetical protein